MTGWRAIYRVLGSLWVAIGVFTLAVTLLYIFLFNVINNEVLKILPPEFIRLLSISPGTPSPTDTPMKILGLFFAGFSLFIGSGLVQLKGWARSLGIVWHAVIGFCLLGLMLVAFQGQDIFIVLLTLVPGIFLILVGIQLGTDAAEEIFAGARAAPAQAKPTECPTCKGPLNLVTLRCPKCDSDFPNRMPKEVYLIDMATQEKHEVLLRQPTYIGRDPDRTVRLDSDYVSGDHAAIEYFDGHFYLHARKNTNYTYVNDRVIRDQEIKDGDILTFAEKKLKFVLTFGSMDAAHAD
jgi:hypothetical protein